MTDSELIAKKLSEIESYVRELKTLASPQKIESDVKEERFAAHTLQLAIQAALDAASHIVSDERLGEPRTNGELFELLEKHDWLDAELAARLRRMAGFRNVLVHGFRSWTERSWSIPCKTGWKISIFSLRQLGLVYRGSEAN